MIIGTIILCRKKDKKFKKKRTILATVGTLFLYFISLIPAFLFPQGEPLKVTGQHKVATKEYTWIDKSRVETYTDTGEKRELTVKFFYPKEEGQYPLAVFSHGSFGVINSNSSTCEELASHGYVVVSIAHTYQAMFVKNVNGDIRIANKDFLNSVIQDNGTNDPKAEKRVFEKSQEWMKIRSADENFVLDTILSKVKSKENGPFQLINESKIGLFGHSMGGATSVEVGRQRKDIKAVIDLEGTMFGEYVGFSNGTEEFNKEPYPIPILDVNSAKIDQEARNLPKESNGYVNFYVGQHALDYHYKVIEGAGHLNFTDLPMISPILAKMLGTGEVNPRECMSQINEMVLQFFDTYLK